MRLLMTTQAVDLDDPVLGFVHQWIELLAGHFESVEVICLKEGRHTLPTNVRVYSLGKERGRRSRIAYAWRFYALLWRLRGSYDAVFVHMNPEYIALAGAYWRLAGKRVVLWYTHREVNPKLRIATAFASAVATAAPESLRIPSSKVRVVGHGIDTAAFAASRDGTLRDPIAIVSVGRITPIKRLEILVEALALLEKRGIAAELTLVGEPLMPGDEAYQEKLLAQARTLGVRERLHLAGAKPYREMPAAYRAHDISVNLAPTGGIDKAVLEAMAAGCLVLVANHAFASLFAEDAPDLLFDGSADELAEKLAALAALSSRERAALTARLVQRTRDSADVHQVIERLVALLA